MKKKEKKKRFLIKQFNELNESVGASENAFDILSSEQEKKRFRLVSKHPRAEQEKKKKERKKENSFLW